MLGRWGNVAGIQGTIDNWENTGADSAKNLFEELRRNNVKRTGGHLHEVKVKKWHWKNLELLCFQWGWTLALTIYRGNNTSFDVNSFVSDKFLDVETDAS